MSITTQRPPPSSVRGILPAVGTTVGGILGPAGAAIGGLAGSALSQAGTGASASSLVPAAASAGTAMARRAAAPAPQGGDRGISNMPQQATPIQRRMDSLDPDEKLRQGEAALAALPPDQQKQYGPIIAQALYLRSQERGMG